MGAKRGTGRDATKKNVVPLRAGLFVRLGRKFWFYLRVGICLVLLVALGKLATSPMSIGSPIGFVVSIAMLLPFAALGAAAFAIADEVRRRRR